MGIRRVRSLEGVKRERRNAASWDVASPLKRIEGNVSSSVEPGKPDTFGHARSHEASKAAYDLCKVMAQSCLLINGGAATAVIALLAKEDVPPVLFTYIPYALALYALGVALSAVTIYCIMMMADHWNYFWYNTSYLGDHTAAAEYEEIANRWQARMNSGFQATIAMFVIGSIIVAIGLSHVPH
jgi:hypothetical protein